MTNRSSPLRWCAPLSALIACLQSIAAPANPEFFEAKIRPVLAEQCYDCHSASAKKLKGGLRVDGRQELLTGGETGPAVVPGQPEKSLLLKALSHQDPDLAMPPKKPKLPDGVIADFERWIREGAEWPAASGTVAKKEVFDLEARKRKQPWLWETPHAQKTPAVQNSDWPISPEDYFILAKLEANGLRPAPPVDERSWLRRVYFVITGLPPSPADIRSFLADPGAGNRERVVDELLASPHFGERWARHWMDLMRYAESRGHESDYPIANAWQYRDYLIRAFNEDVPYNQFVSEHIAGDLLPHPRLRPGTTINESVLATGWPFLGEENHSPVDIRGDECERLDNKVDVFSKTFLGLTVSCARCHDHKFDAIRAQDYYALSGFLLSSSFRQVRFEAEQNNREIAAELCRLRNEFAPRLARATVAADQAGIGKIAETLQQAGALAAADGTNAGNRLPSMDSARLWLEHLRAASTNASSPIHLLARQLLELPAPTNLANERAALPPNGRIVADFTRPDRQPWKADGPGFGSGPAEAGDLILGNDPAHPIARVMPYGAARRDLFWNRLKNASGNEDDSGRLAATARAGQMIRTPTVTLESGKLHYLLRGKAKVYASVDSHLMNEGPLHAILLKAFDTGREVRWVTHDLSAYAGHRAHIEFGPDGPGELEILMAVESPETPSWMPALHYQPSKSASRDALAMEFQKAVEMAAGQLSNGRVSPENALLADWLVQNPRLLRGAESSGLAEAATGFLKAQSGLASRVQWESHTAVALFDGTGVDENVLIRGKPFKPGPLAPRSLPAAFAAARPITCAASSGRQELAEQLTDPANPLVARVFVNRMWHHVFGRGIVATVDNFGALGERPTHPELLDHLAWQFIHQDEWSLKRLVKRLVLSQTFRMSSLPASPEIEERDPSNVLLHRMNVRRLESEVIRDELLAVSGRLSPAVGGPPEPVHLTEFLVGRGRPDKSGPLDGDGRRSVYLAVRRNFLPTFMLTFDTPTPFSTVGRRNVTNVPAQSLALMNDPLFHQQAEVWAQRMLRETPREESTARIRWLFESAYGRPPEAAEIAACEQSLREIRQLVAEQKPAAAWAELCHALLNSNEFIYVR